MNLLKTFVLMAAMALTAGGVAMAKDCCSKEGSACCASKEKCNKCCAPGKDCCSDKAACEKCCKAEKK
jgi:hypothetical protein